MSAQRTVIAFVVLAAAVAVADRPMLPRIVEVSSPKKAYRARHVPEFTWGKKRVRHERHGLFLERRVKKAWKEVWFVPGQPWAVPSMLVADSGKYVVLLHSPADVDQPGAVVIYGPGGKLVRKLSLKDFLSAEELGGVMRSVSHVVWDLNFGGDGREPHRIDEEQEHLVLRVSQGGQLPPMYEQPPPVLRRIALHTGEVLFAGR